MQVLFNTLRLCFIFSLGILCKVISLTPVIMFLTILDHLLVQTICFRLLFHLLFLCGIAYQLQTMLKFLHFLLLRLMYRISMTAIQVASLLSICDKFFIEKKFCTWQLLS